MTVSAGPPPRRDAVTPLGEQLKAERERRGVRLDQVAESTKIRKTYLEALERNDWEALPADVFTRGYLRSYAQHLGMDVAHLLKVYARERRIADVEDPSTKEQRERDEARALLERIAKSGGGSVRGTSAARTRWIVLGLAACGLAAVAAVGVLRWSGRGDERVPPPPSPRPVASAPVQAVPPPAIAAAPEPVKPQTPPPSPRSSLQIPEYGVGTQVVGHRLIGKADRFAEGTSVYFWTNVFDGRRGEKIRHVWRRDGITVAIAELRVDGARWRTQSRRPLPPGSAGSWTVEARDADGRVLASSSFVCVPNR
ncbi:MAG TPA: DUF2914 domain-containing protein [Candidatus Polarisedimenticolaceae bacterium]|nr:DUF2914 domain-containing protein [Candidatus Polarisedimenticolaceae bacterium]